MQLLKSGILILLALVLFTSCTSDETDQEDSSEADLDFYFGSFGGLCGFSDSLSIFSNLDTHYDLKVFCDDIDHEISKTVDRTEYDALVNSFSLTDFETLNYNSCDRCLDGTDSFLHVVGSDFKHRIVYSQANDLRLIQNLITALDAIRETHQPE